MNEFYQKWFSGINDYLNDKTKKEGETDCFLGYCAKKCSDSYPVSVYRKAFSENGTLSGALKSLREQFSDFTYDILEDRILVIYKRCGCELITDKLLDSPEICRCSELSLKYLWESVYGTGNVQVKIIESILRGDGHCVFEIQIKDMKEIS